MQDDLTVFSCIQLYKIQDILFVLSCERIQDGDSLVSNNVCYQLSYPSYQTFIPNIQYVHNQASSLAFLKFSISNSNAAIV